MNITAVHAPHLLAPPQEVCPLCLAQYEACSERLCAICEAQSCPDCADPVGRSEQFVCSACHSPSPH